VKKYLLYFVTFAFSLGSFAAQGQTLNQKKNTSRAAPVAEAPAPAPPMPSAPVPVTEQAPAAIQEAPAPAMPEYATRQPVEGTLDGVYVGGCTKVTGTGGNLTGLVSIELTESGNKFRNVIRFYTSEDCTGSVYAAVSPPTRVNRIVGKRHFPLPTGQGQSLVWYSQQNAQDGEMNFFGAVIKNPQNPAQMVVVFNNSTLYSVAIAHSAQSENFILSATNEGLNVAGSRTQGVELDSQGFPKTFGINSFYARRQ
jgi:hypothetical protein